MAARENQGYLIAVIILVLLTVVLALAAFLGISRATEYADAAASFEAKANLNDTVARAQEARAQVLESMIGGLGSSTAEIQTLADSLDKLQAQVSETTDKNQLGTIITRVRELRDKFETDMKIDVQADQGDQEVESTYSQLITDMASVLDVKHGDVNILRNEINRIKAETDKTIAAKDAEIKAMQDRLATKQNDFDTETANLRQKINELDTALDEIKDANNKTNNLLRDAREAFVKKEQELNGQIASISQENVILKEKIDVYERETFDLPDGKIVRAASDIVFIDLGSADGLRTNRTFSVYDQSVTNFEKGRHKAAIEVTRILGPHQAEARIVDSSITNPIIRGDFILTPTWDPGYRTAIALVGFFDLDSDGRSDRERLIRMIEANGGQVVAYHDEDGKVTGKIDSGTRYVVLGNSPEAGQSPDGIFNAIDTLLSQSKKNSVQEIDVKKLLDWMGAPSQSRIERLDAELGNEFRRWAPVDRLQGNPANRR